MKKVFIQGFIIVLSFLFIFYAFKRIPWKNIFPIEAISKKTEEGLGKVIIESINQTHETLEDQELNGFIDSLITVICKSNQLEKEKYKIHIIREGEINAFALPDAHIVIHTGLIEQAKNPEGLFGVIAHEMAHVEQNHVMQKLLKEMGLNALLSIVTGGNQGGVLQETAKVLSSTAFDRGLESEADMTAISYLSNANINPIYFADFMRDLAAKEPKEMQYFKWISTHPESKERAEKIAKKSRSLRKNYKSILSEAEWKALVENVKAAQTD